MEYLTKVISLDHNNNYTTLQITTNKRRYKIKLPYTIYHSNNDKDKDIVRYSLSIKDWCRTRDILIGYYFNLRNPNT